MNQIKYVLYASLIVIAAFLLLCFFNKISTTGSVSNTAVVINSDTQKDESSTSSEGKRLFQQNCQTCHAINKNLTGPALAGIESRGPWNDRKQLYAWINNPAAFMAKDQYTKALQKQYGTIMQAFPTLSNQEIDAIVAYINFFASKASPEIAMK